MKGVWGKVLAGVGVIVLSGTAVSACVHDDSSFFIRAVLAPPNQTQAGAICTFSGDPTQPELFEGVMDVALTTSYQGVFLVGNQIIPRGDPTLPRVETSRIVIQGAVVRITDATGGALASYTTLSSGFVDPPNGSTPTYGPTAFTIVDPNTVKAITGQGLPKRLITFTTAFGTTLGGQHVESNEFEFPVTVCEGCLVNFDTVVAPGITVPNCLGPAPMAPASVCIFGQEQPVDCHFCFSNPACNPGGTILPVDAGGGG